MPTSITFHRININENSAKFINIFCSLLSARSPLECLTLIRPFIWWFIHCRQEMWEIQLSVEHSRTHVRPDLIEGIPNTFVRHRPWRLGLYHYFGTNVSSLRCKSNAVLTARARQFHFRADLLLSLAFEAVNLEFQRSDETYFSFKQRLGFTLHWWTIHLSGLIPFKKVGL